MEYQEWRKWDPPGSCPGGCGQPKDKCICKKRPFKTFSQVVEETENEIAEGIKKGEIKDLTLKTWERFTGRKFDA